MKRDALEQLAREIATAVYNAYSNTLVGTASPRVHELNDRIRDVRIGDLVIEHTTCLMPSRPALDAVGYLLRDVWEPVKFSDPDFVWDEKEEGQPHPKERIFYIRTLDGREFRWENASLISAPTEWKMRKSIERAA